MYLRFMIKKPSAKDEVIFKLKLNVMIDSFPDQDKLKEFKEVKDNQIHLLTFKNGYRVHMNGLNKLPTRLLPKVLTMINKFEAGDFDGI